MKKEEAFKAIEQTPEPGATRGNKIDYAALAGVNFKTKK